MPDDDHQDRISQRWSRFTGLGLTALLCSLLFFAWNPLRTYMQAAAIFFELDSSRIPLVLAPVAHHPAEVTNVTIEVTNRRSLRGLLYTPTDVTHPPAIVLLHGVHRLGYDEPRLVAFASALARCGFLVLTPELAELRDYRITPASVQDIQTSIIYLAQGTGKPVSVMGLSFAGGLALLAVADPAVAPHVKAVLSVGGHASFARVAEYYVSGRATGAEGAVFAVAPHDYGPLVLAYEHMGDYVPVGDAGAITAVLQAHLYENSAAEKSLTAKLSSRQQGEWRLMEDSLSPQEIALARASNAKHISAMDAVSPEGKIASLPMPVFLLHGAGDNVIPPTELSWLQRDLPPREVRGTLVSRLISHVSFGQSHPSIADYWHGLRFLAHFLGTAAA